MPGADIDPRARLGPGVSVWHLAQIREGAEMPSNGWTQQRQQNVKFLDANLRGVVLPPVADGAIHVAGRRTRPVRRGHGSDRHGRSIPLD